MASSDRRQHTSSEHCQHDLCRSETLHATFPEPQDDPKPIRLWSASGGMDENESSSAATSRADSVEQDSLAANVDLRERTFQRRCSMPVSSSPYHRRHSTRDQSVNYVVAGLKETYPQSLLAPYDIEPEFWRRFIQAVNAALSEFPAWKSLHELTAGRQRRRFSFDATMSAASSDRRSRSVWWTDDTCGASGREQAEKLLRWWNEDYFKQKGCWITLGFQRDDIPTAASNGGEESVCDPTTSNPPILEVDSDSGEPSSAAREPIVLSSSPTTISNSNSSLKRPGLDVGGSGSTLKPFLTIYPL